MKITAKLTAGLTAALMGLVPLATSAATVTIDKFVDGTTATSGPSSANGSSFGMTSSWNASNIGAGSGTYALGPTGFNSPNAYEAVTADMSSGASYTTSESTSTAVGTDCAAGQTYRLAGYTSGDTFSAASAGTPTMTAPNFTNITSNKFVIVWNRHCLAAPTPLSPANGSATTTAGQTKVDWTDVTNGVGGITYIYQASNATSTNPDGSFTSPVYTSGPLTASEIPTPGTPVGTYYWHVMATDARGNTSAWSTVWKFTVDNTPAPNPNDLACMLSANKTTITRGESVTLTWTSANATKRKLTTDHGSIDVAANGTLVVSPKGSRPYILSVTKKFQGGADFKQCTVWITVNEPNQQAQQAQTTGVNQNNLDNDRPPRPGR
jgi:hypothetical protein